MATIHFSERQQKTVAAATTLLAGALILSFAGVLLFFAGWLIVRFSSILLPLAVAGVLALMLKPYHWWLTGRLKGRRLAAVALVYVSILVPATLFGVVFGAQVISELADFLSRVPEWAGLLQRRAEEHLPAVRDFWIEHDLTARVREAMARHGAVIGRSLGNLTGVAIGAWGSVFRSIAGVLSWFILPVYLAFFLMGEPVTRRRFEELLPFLKPATRADLSYLVFEFVEILVSFFRGQVLIAFLQGLLFAAGFAVVGLQYGFTLGLALGFLNVIPYLGSMVGLSIGLPLAFFQEGGGILRVGLVLAVFTAVQCIEGYLLTPKIMGDRTGLHPLAIIVAIFFWGSVFGGITGMILAIPLTAFLVVLWRLLKSKYITELI